MLRLLQTTDLPFASEEQVQYVDDLQQKWNELEQEADELDERTGDDPDNSIPPAEVEYERLMDMECRDYW